MADDESPAGRRDASSEERVADAPDDDTSQGEDGGDEGGEPTGS